MLRFFSRGKECRARTATAATIETREETFLEFLLIGNFSLHLLVAIAKIFIHFSEIEFTFAQVAA
jgi:hypothetical protein